MNRQTNREGEKKLQVTKDKVRAELFSGWMCQQALKEEMGLVCF